MNAHRKTCPSLEKRVVQDRAQDSLAVVVEAAPRERNGKKDGHHLPEAELPTGQDKERDKKIERHLGWDCV